MNLFLPHSIYRQNASSLIFPPDPYQDWCYINLSPDEFCNTISTIYNEYISIYQLCRLIYDRKNDNLAYLNYYKKWKSKINIILDV